MHGRLPPPPVASGSALSPISVPAKFERVRSTRELLYPRSRSRFPRVSRPSSADSAPSALGFAPLSTAPALAPHAHPRLDASRMRRPAPYRRLRVLGPGARSSRVLAPAGRLPPHALTHAAAQSSLIRAPTVVASSKVHIQRLSASLARPSSRDLACWYGGAGGRRLCGTGPGVLLVRSPSGGGIAACRATAGKLARARHRLRLRRGAVRCVRPVARDWYCRSTDDGLRVGDWPVRRSELRVLRTRTRGRSPYLWGTTVPTAAVAGRSPVLPGHQHDSACVHACRRAPTPHPMQYQPARPPAGDVLGSRHSPLSPGPARAHRRDSRDLALRVVTVCTHGTRARVCVCVERSKYRRLGGARCRCAMCDGRCAMDQEMMAEMGGEGPAGRVGSMNIEIRQSLLASPGVRVRARGGTRPGVNAWTA